jgi:hypothetical protein
VALFVAAVVAMPLTASIVRWAGLQRSTWMRITLRSAPAVPPALRVVYGDPDQALPVTWDASATRTLIGLRADAPVRLLNIDTDRGVAPPWFLQTWGPGLERVSNPSALLIRDAGVIDLVGSFERLTLTFEPSRARVSVGWLDLEKSVDLSTTPNQPQTLTLELPTARRGWVLLPPVAMGRLEIRGEALAGPVVLDDVRIESAPPQVWSGPTAVPAIAADRGLVLQGLRPVNAVALTQLTAIWASLTLAIVAILAGVAAIARRVQTGERRAKVFANGTAERAWTRAAGWPLAGVVVAVTAITFAYHVSYALAISPQYNFDSLGYYAFGRNLMHTGGFSAVATCRTPGYPAAIAMMTSLAGDRILPLIIVQHVSFCVLGGIVVWFLYSRVSPLWSAIGGLLAGASPAIAITASTVWTEALFVTLATMALLVFLKESEPRPRSLLIGGFLAGIATLIRPNGALVLVLMTGWLFLQWWCHGIQGKRRRLVGRVVLLVTPFLVVCGPWIVHFHRETGRWGLSDANCGQPGQVHLALTRGLHPTNVFQLAAFINLTSQGDAASRLAITEPQRAFFTFFPARHRYYALQFFPWSLIYDDRYTGEVFREYVRGAWPTYVRQATDALVFNVANVRPAGSTIFVYPDLADLVDRARARPAFQPPNREVARLARLSPVTWANAEVLLADMAAHAVRDRPVMRARHLRVTQAAMQVWGISVALAVLGTAAVLLIPGDRRVSLLAIHVFSLAAAPAVLAMGVDRYAMEGEPVVYVLCVILLSLLFDRGIYRRSQTGGVVPSRAVGA